jgi:hypothetical protein
MLLMDTSAIAKITFLENNVNLNIISVSFSCICPIDYTGTLCNQLKDSCAILPCSNGGTCINMVTD